MTPEIDSVMGQFKQLAAKHDISVQYPDSLLHDYEHAWYSAPFEVREQELYDALTDQNSQVIWAMRGGSGAAELLMSDRIIEAIRSTKKILIGFSDITSLHLAFNSLNTMPTLHGPVVSSVVKHPEAFDEVIQMLRGERLEYALEPLNKVAAEHPKISASILGGNLAVFASMMGTDLMPCSDKKILMFEDVNEAGYQIMRFATQFAMAGLWDKCSAILLGEFTKTDQYYDFVLNSILGRFLVDIPVYKINHIGHIPHNRPIILNTPIKIENNQLIACHNF